MKKPVSQISEVLFELIRKRRASFHNFAMQDFRKCISLLVNEHKLNLKREMVKETNRYGNQYQYAVHSLPEKSRDKAVKLYDKLISK